MTDHHVKMIRTLSFFFFQMHIQYFVEGRAFVLASPVLIIGILKSLLPAVLCCHLNQTSRDDDDDAIIVMSTTEEKHV